MCGGGEGGGDGGGGEGEGGGGEGGGGEGDGGGGDGCGGGDGLNPPSHTKGWGMWQGMSFQKGPPRRISRQSSSPCVYGPPFL